MTDCIVCSASPLHLANRKCKMQEEFYNYMILKQSSLRVAYSLFIVFFKINTGILLIPVPQRLFTDINHHSWISRALTVMRWWTGHRRLRWRSASLFFSFTPRVLWPWGEFLNKKRWRYESTRSDLNSFAPTNYNEVRSNPLTIKGMCAERLR